MTPLDQQPTSRLLNRRAELWEQLRLARPGIANEVSVIDQILKAREKGGDRPFEQYAGKPAIAILALFTELGGEGVEISVEELWAALGKRGYPVAASDDRALVRDAVNRMLKKKTLVKVNDELGAKMRVSLTAAALKKVHNL